MNYTHPQQDGSVSIRVAENHNPFVLSLPLDTIPKNPSGKICGAC